MRAFTSEQVSKHRPDTDQISDAVSAVCPQQDRESRVACDRMVKGKSVYQCGEITTRAEANCSEAAEAVEKNPGYGVENIVQQIAVQLPEFADAVKKSRNLCTDDQDIMSDFTCCGTMERLPF